MNPLHVYTQRLHKIPGDCGYNCIYDFETPFENTDLDVTFVDWCLEHTQKRWGWYYTKDDHNEPTLMITFESQQDLVHFKLTYHE